MRPFLSHQWNDKKIVKLIAEELIENEMDPILDVWEFIPGDSLTESMITGVKKSTQFILFWSINAKRSQNIKFERELSLIKKIKNIKFKVICILLDSTPLPFEFSDSIYIDWRRGKNKGKIFYVKLDYLIRAIRGLPFEQKPTRYKSILNNGIFVENHSGLIFPLANYASIDIQSILYERKNLLVLFLFGSPPQKINNTIWRGNGFEVKKVSNKGEKIVRESIKVVSENDPEIEFYAYNNLLFITNFTYDPDKKSVVPFYEEVIDYCTDEIKIEYRMLLEEKKWNKEKYERITMFFQMPRKDVRIHMKEKEYFNAIYKKLYELRNLGMIETEKILDFLNDSRNYWWYDGAIAEAVNDILEELNIIKKIKKYITDPQS